ncbi:MAG: hypothetical protein P0116_14705 [Candidatus Nitrosocosmicus sp.]|nr:hypothetical protein [Candidatus Nitrosocosmicus sp.]
MDSKTNENKSSAAFFLSLAAGILILFANMMPLMSFSGLQWNPMNWMSAMSEGGTMMHGDGGIMMQMQQPWHGMWLTNPWYLYLLLVSGIIILIGATMLNKNPHLTLTGAILVIVFSIFGLFGPGISLLGGMFGIIGGLLALTQRNRRIRND